MHEPDQTPDVSPAKVAFRALLERLAAARERSTKRLSRIPGGGFRMQPRSAPKPPTTYHGARRRDDGFDEDRLIRAMAKRRRRQVRNLRNAREAA